MSGHYCIHRDVGWLKEDDGELVEQYAELPVCGVCVPKHSHFRSRADVPLWPCGEPVSAPDHGPAEPAGGEGL